MTTSTQLVARVRSNINEPTGNTDPQRSDAEIRQWLEDAQHDYLSKVPADSVPELLTSANISGTSWTLPADFVKLAQVMVVHGGAVDPAYILGSDEGWLAERWPGAIGAWAQFRAGALAIGPSASSGTVTYVRTPTTMAVDGNTFSLGAEHEEPIVNYATARALAKINDQDAPSFLEAYDARIQAERGKYVPLVVEPAQ